MRGIMGGFYKISEWIMRLSVTNILWVICSSPFFFLLLSMLISPGVSEDGGVTSDIVKQWLLTLAIVAPFTLVPASAAMFSVVRKWVMGEEDVPLFKTFFRGYKQNYLQSMLGGLIFLAIAVILYINFLFYTSQSDTMKLLSYLFIMLFVLLVGAFLNFLSITVHFHMKLFQIVKNAFLLTIGNPIGTIVTLVCSGFIMYISSKYTFLIPFFMGSLIAFVAFWQFYRNFQRIQDKMEKLAQKEQEGKEGKGKGKETEKIEPLALDDSANRSSEDGQANK
ncbi:YesL family protein [Paenibacillus cymbidii]|uniref:YesL family protein n=1 Tax=Paenibacillus cymbidii TaxID=1639034 RepID=UPI001F2773C9|nr:DUF624 domain-containing protein [Paenibacillus cymbidii]